MSRPGLSLYLRLRDDGTAYLSIKSSSRAPEHQDWIGSPDEVLGRAVEALVEVLDKKRATPAAEQSQAVSEQLLEAVGWAPEAEAGA